MRTLLHYLRWSIGLAAPETRTTVAERECLAHHVVGRKRVVEIGVWHGVTTLRLLKSMAHDGILCAIDPYPSGRLGVNFAERIAHRTVRPLDRGRVRWLRETGAGVGRRF